MTPITLKYETRKGCSDLWQNRTTLAAMRTAKSILSYSCQKPVMTSGDCPTREDHSVRSLQEVQVYSEMRIDCTDF
ncbi:hypothetical protein SERLA73DRAFT_187320 [Serpula lacrymans var. lacrymans S7.3]|uniref:Uncharacterized protein n=1 Tax=Serpula lacrymans var. lacrymans (strain S7.3) TaxID=936435 RepID=F8Q8Y1_SERL3|nr:hypothetical protein SERLA73DRAFT_187320 [Serpula lacrymans var. lacrymans S7.3]